MSRIDFTPAETTVIGTSESTLRSADSSNVSDAPRCTPPRPPVAKTRMPARSAMYEVAATVVAPLPPRASTIGRSRTLSLGMSSPAMRTSSSSVSPALSWPSSTAIVAGTTPIAVRIASNPRAASRLSGRGRPCEMIVDSSATTGVPASSAAATAGEMLRGSVTAPPYPAPLPTGAVT